MSQSSRIGQTYGDYEVLDPLGQGGMGEVFRAHQKSLKRDVAIKFISQKKYHDELNRKRFLREIRACSALQHPNIIKIYDYGEQGGDIFLVMEILEGKALEEYIGDAAGGLPPEFVTKVMDDLLSALTYMHPIGYVHRDIKPANIFLTRFNRAVLMDFGLVKTSGDSQLTRTGKMVGTPRYLPPEVLMGEVADHRGDLFQVGLVMIECLLGELPFRQRDMLAYVKGDKAELPIDVEKLFPGRPDNLRQFLKNALSIEVESRYQDTQEMLDDLRRLRDDKPVEPLRPVDASGFPRVFPDLVVTRDFQKRFQFRKYVSKDTLITVVQAVESDSNRVIEITFLSPRLKRSIKDQKSLLRELKLLEEMKSAHLSLPREVGRLGEVLYLVHPAPSETRLHEFLQVDPTYPAPVVAALLMQLIRSLRSLHQAGLAHGYLGPSTVALSPGGRVTLVGPELGVLHRHSLMGERTLTAVGLSYFSAPELLEGQIPAVTSDLYSLGALGYRLLTGSFAEPWGPEPGGASKRRTEMPPAEDPFEKLLLRLIARDPGRRGPDLDELERELATHLGARELESTVADGLGTVRDREIVKNQGPGRVLDGGAPSPRARLAAMLLAVVLSLICIYLVTMLEKPIGPPEDLQFTPQDSSVEIRWRSERPYPTVIELGKDRQSLETIRLEGEPTDEHRVVVDTLVPETRYVFRVLGPDGSPSILYSFETTARKKVTGSPSPR